MTFPHNYALNGFTLHWLLSCLELVGLVLFFGGFFVALLHELIENGMPSGALWRSMDRGWVAMTGRFATYEQRLKARVRRWVSTPTTIPNNPPHSPVPIPVHARSGEVEILTGKQAVMFAIAVLGMIVFATVAAMKLN